MAYRPLEELCALVDGEKIDLNDYDRRISLVKRSLSRCNSNQTLQESKHGHAATWKKLANNLYKPIPTYSIYKTHPRDRLKQTRAASADPRFRQERKSTTSLLGQSNVNVVKTNSSLRPSTSKLNNLHHMKLYNADIDFSRRVLSKHRIPIKKSKTFVDEVEKQRISKEPPHAYQSSFNNKDKTDVSYYGSTFSVDNENNSSTMNKEVLEDAETALETIEFESLQENFVSSLQQNRTADRNMTPRNQNDWPAATTVNTDEELRSNNPDWSTIDVYKPHNVPTHLIRHCPVIKSKHVLKKSTSSWTMPVVKHKIPPGVCVCQKCDCCTVMREGHKRKVHSQKKTYLYDGCSDVSSRKRKMIQMYQDMGVLRKLWKQFLANYHLLMCFFFGSLIGLILVASVVWLLSNDHLWTIFNKKEVRKINPVRAGIMSIGSGLNQALNAILGTVYQTIMLPRKAVYTVKTDDSTTLGEFLTSFIS